MTQHEQLDEALVARIAGAILREVYRVPEAAKAPEPEYAPDAYIRDKILKISRSGYYAMSRRPDFPPAFEPTGPNGAKYRHVQSVREFVESQLVDA